MCGRNAATIQVSTRFVTTVSQAPPGEHGFKSRTGTDAGGRAGDAHRGRSAIFERAAERIRGIGYPLVEEQAVRYVLNPPTEAATIELFTPFEVT